jgi:hypothetical protein
MFWTAGGASAPHGLCGAPWRSCPGDAAGVTQLRPCRPKGRNRMRLRWWPRRFLDILPHRSVPPAGAFWLDGHYLVARCPEGLDAFGALATPASCARPVSKPLPELVRYKFLDGCPFASPRTTEWLDSLESPLSGHAMTRVAKGAGEAVRERNCWMKAWPSGRSGDSRPAWPTGEVPAGRSRAAVRQGLLLARYCIAAGNNEGGRAPFAVPLRTIGRNGSCWTGSPNSAPASFHFCFPYSPRRGERGGDHLFSVCTGCISERRWAVSRTTSDRRSMQIDSQGVCGCEG